MDLKINKDTAVVFDLDDTLYNELDYLKSSYKEIAEKVDLKNSKKLYAQMISLYRNEKNVFQFLSELYAIEIRELISIYRNHIPNIVLFDGIINLFESIKNKGGKIALITDGRSKTQRNKIRQLGIEDDLDIIIISEEIGSEKPSLKNFQAVEKSLKTSSNIYIADNLKKDFIAPNLLGWNSICLADNGKNIHINKMEYFLNDKHAAKNFVYNLKEINIL
ncbi:HAD family hydrolase [Cellulophaga sp. HaHaR_3_176]|uniref:HAD family hydrolase n=1 Tax=Cellulophaga sp. HaHaR_3_176 TaxID=1942464 RepID=UPI001C1F50A6|nr:HAD-IA family hydrolase [Cellulophaga sp. HaHaR_3_176]QWX84790.1 HAD family hydrolase [Cellulophaga sp. HaHaR_3_176]